MNKEENIRVTFDSIAFHNARDFAKRWMRKVGKRIDKKSESFDRFIAYYVAYSALVKVIKPAECRYDKDEKYCTKAMAQFIVSKSNGITTLLDSLELPALGLANIIETQHFSVLSSWGNNPNLLSNWCSGDESQKLLALLQTLYYLRCNIFHGAKDYSDFQQDLLNIAVDCLVIINNEILSIYSKIYTSD